MSYSFNVRGASAALALAAVAAELDKVVAAQPIHAADRDQAEEAAKAFVGLIGEPAEGQEVSVSVNGSLGRAYVDGQFTDDVTSANVGVSAQLVIKTE